MKYLEGSAVAELLPDLISPKHQQHDFETDLTVAGMDQLVSPGSVDFGGSELTPADVTELQPKKRSEDDKYGWWDLKPGSYRLRYNEKPQLGETHIAFVQPHERLIAAGATHPTFYFRGPREQMETLLTVGSAGLRVKENARVSKLLVLTTE